MSRGTVETTAFIAFTRRILRALARRVADADEVELGMMIELQATLDDSILQAVAGMRARGCSWAYIGSATGTTKQAASKRWAARVDKLIADH